MIRYAVFPGRVISKVEGDVHYIAADVLMHLYQVNPKECIVIDEERLDKRELKTLLDRVAEDHLICLMPRYDGKYQLPRSKRG